MNNPGKLFSALCAFYLTSAIGAHAEPLSFRRVSIDGAMVRWLPSAGNDPIRLRYAIITRELKIPDARNCGHMRQPTNLQERSLIDPAAFKAAAKEAFSWWQRAANISFVEAVDDADADILIGEQSEPVGYAFTNISTEASLLKQAPVRAIASAQICLNPQQRWKIGFDGDLAVYDLVHTIAHEIGHAIGLDHPVERSALMSFRYHESRAGLSEGDILGAASIYGDHAMTSTASGSPAREHRALQ